jgi:hypothetical protein
MLEHYETLKHQIGFSLSDGSYWCFDCEDYITNHKLDQLRMKFSTIKFPSDELDSI